jgi:hypothetical protein
LEGNELFLAFRSWEGGFKTIDKNTLRSFKCEHIKKGWFLKNRCHNQGWLLFRPRWSNSDIKVAWDHQKLVDEVYTFHLDLTLLNLEVYSFTFINPDAIILFDSFTHIYLVFCLCFIYKIHWYSLFYVLNALLNVKLKKK